MTWSRDLLIKAIHYNLAGQFSEDEPFDSVHDGMAPLEAIKETRMLMQRPPKLPGSPKKKPQRRPM